VSDRSYHSLEQPYQHTDRALLEADAVAALEGLSKREQQRSVDQMSNMFGQTFLPSPQKLSPAPTPFMPYFAMVPQMGQLPARQGDSNLPQHPPAAALAFNYSYGLPTFNQVVNTAIMAPSPFLDNSMINQNSNNAWMQQKF
jgi:hypothetical protein